MENNLEHKFYKKQRKTLAVAVISGTRIRVTDMEERREMIDNTTWRNLFIYLSGRSYKITSETPDYFIVAAN